MINKPRYRNLFTAPQGEQRDHDQQATPIFDLIAQALHKYDILGLTKFDDLAYEDMVVWLLQHLPEAHDVQSVEGLMVQAFTEQQGSLQCDPEDALLMKALAEDIWRAWSQYLQRNETATFSHARTRAQGLMSRHYYPRTTSH